MVSQIPRKLGAAIVGLELRILRGQGAQAIGGVQVLAHRAENRPLLCRAEHGKGHGQRPNLIAANLLVCLRAGNHILQIALFGHIEFLHKGFPHSLCQLRVILSVTVQFFRQNIHNPQGIVPVRVDLHRFAMAGCGQNPVYADIHPGHLVKALPRKDQAVLVHADTVEGAFAVIGNNPVHRLPCLPGKGPVTGALHILPHTVDQQQRGIHRIIHGCLISLGEQIGYQSILLIGKEGTQDALCILIAAGSQAAAGQGDHGISAPVAEQGISGHNGFAVYRVPADNISIRTAFQLPRGRVPEFTALFHLGNTVVFRLQQFPAG